MTSFATAWGSAVDYWNKNEEKFEFLYRSIRIVCILKNNQKDGGHAWVKLRAHCWIGQITVRPFTEIGNQQAAYNAGMSHRCWVKKPSWSYGCYFCVQKELSLNNNSLSALGLGRNIVFVMLWLVCVYEEVTFVVFPGVVLGCMNGHRCNLGDS